MWLYESGQLPDDGAEPPPECIFNLVATTLNVSCNLAIAIMYGITIALFLIIIACVAACIVRKYDNKVKLTQKYMKSLGIDVLSESHIATLDVWELPRDRVVINRKLGEGAFGTVYGGEANFGEKGWLAVAVKTLKVGSSTEDKLDFLSEAEVMKRFDHQNIVKLMGVCTKSEPVYTVMEFMLYGDLKTYLLARRHIVNEKTAEESDEVSSKRLTTMALDVARALSYLAEMKYVHRDVASRNCMVNAQKSVKLGDFGMTRSIFENDYYKFSRKGMLPVRWMAPESLGLGIFTPASDVWSYGVLLYEIITFGSFPFQGLSNNQVLEHVKCGNTIKIPHGVKPQLNNLICSCWNREPKLRINASEIVEFLANNSKIITPCLDVPIASVQMEDTDQIQMHLPEEFQKEIVVTAINGSIFANGNIYSQMNDQIPSTALHEEDQDTFLPSPEMIASLQDSCCAHEPLLGHNAMMSTETIIMSRPKKALPTPPPLSSKAPPPPPPVTPPTTKTPPPPPLPPPPGSTFNTPVGSTPPIPGPKHSSLLRQQTFGSLSTSTYPDRNSNSRHHPTESKDSKDHSDEANDFVNAMKAENDATDSRLPTNTQTKP